VRVGAPYVDGATVTAKVVRQGKGRKIEGFTFKAKKNERRRFGHRQLFTELVIQTISA
jgi:large subunit ribosomal protein L21